MKEYNVKVTPYAKEQMMEIRDYIAYQILNPDAARNQIIKIRAEIRKLSQFPDNFPIGFVLLMNNLGEAKVFEKLL